MHIVSAGACAYICKYVCLFVVDYTIAAVYQLYHGVGMMYEMESRKPDPIHLLTQVIFNLPHRTGII